MKDDELVAKFMGITVRDIGKGLLVICDQDGDFDWMEPNYYTPSRDWNDLMAVVHRIYDVAPIDVQEINSNSLQIFEWGSICVPIEDLYKSVVDFIRWHNSQSLDKQ